MKIVIEEVGFWMDGGTITLEMKKDNSVSYKVEFVQKVFLEKSIRDYVRPTPGSLRLNNEDIEIRSELEKEILSEIKEAEFGLKIKENDKDSFKEAILEAISFVESENYIIVAKKVGRIK